jgi:uncharacterized protein (DUF488 family)
MKLYTIGFTQKTAEDFFEALRQNGVQLLVDIRLRPSGQLAGFAKSEDLPYFLANLAGGCGYVHLPELAPTKEILDEYRLDHDWPRYVSRFEALMDERQIPQVLSEELIASTTCCLLCSEATADRCHRRLVAERMVSRWSGLEIVHL